jgi:hypothetical protein
LFNSNYLNRASPLSESAFRRSSSLTPPDNPPSLSPARARRAYSEFAPPLAGGEPNLGIPNETPSAGLIPTGRSAKGFGGGVVSFSLFSAF